MVKTPRRAQNTDTKIEQWLADKGVTWDFFEAFDLDLVDVERSLKNQARISAPLRPEQVEVYTDAMKRGEVFPPIVVWESPLKSGSFIVVDGNHRVTAGVGAEVPLSAYVVPRNTPAELVRQLTYEANTRHGMGTTKAERQQHAMWIIENTARSMQDVAAELNIPYGELQRYVYAQRTEARINALRIPEMIWREIAPSVRNRLNTLGDDDVFRAAVETAGKMRMSAADIDDFLRGIKVGRTSAEQLQIIKDYTDENRQRLAEVATGDAGPVKGRPLVRGPRRSLVTSAVFIRKVHTEQMDDMLADMQPEEAAEIVGHLRTMQAQLDDIVAKLEEKVTEAQ